MKGAVHIDANVIRQLGDELVTDAEQAILELIKNSYDADAEWVRLLLDTEHELTPPLERPGLIRVEDNGTGMTLQQLHNGWLRISLSLKREIKASGKTSTRGRTPLGDKGLGRLSTMKLGDVVEIQTYPSPTVGYSVTLNWSAFSPGTDIGDITVNIEEIAPIGRTGTTLNISSLRNVEYWRRRNSADRLQGSLSKLISPFRKVPDFRVTGQLNGTPIAPEYLTRRLRETATTHFSFQWGDEGLRCTGLLKLSLFAFDEFAFQRHILPDGGTALFDALAKSRQGRALRVRAARAPWFIQVEKAWSSEELVPPHERNRRRVDDPGPFDGEVDGFDLDTMQDVHTELFSSRSDYRDFVKRLSGVSIYRDGFAIRAENDWLGLGASWTSGRSYYGLRPANTVGFVAISAAHNQTLIEKSDREGFLDNSASRGFADIVATFVEFANESLTVLRREFNTFRSARKAADAQLPVAFKEADALDALKRLGRTVARRSMSIRTSEDRRRESFSRLRTDLRAASGLPSLDQESRQALRAATGHLARAVSAWEKSAREVVAAAEEFEQQSRIADAVGDRLDQLKNQNDELLEFVAIGLVAQALAHDVRMLLDDLLSRTRRLSSRIEPASAEDLAVYIESVRGTVHALRKQLALLDPMQRAARETKQRVVLSSFLEELLQFRAEKYGRHEIEASVTVQNDFTVLMNRGRLLQVFDNLVRNSEYWLQHSTTTRRSIRIAVDRPSVAVFDNGPGVKESLEETLFEPFVTDKPRGYGSGLGLFIVSQLLKRENCGIGLSADRNGTGRRYRFLVDFSGATVE